MQHSEVRHAVVARDTPFAVDNDGLHPQRAHSRYDPRKSVGPVVAAFREYPDTLGLPPHYQAITVVLNFVNPEAPAVGSAA